MRPIKVFISSPGDLFPEREVIKRVLGDLNAHPQYRDRFKLIPLLWEDHAPAWVGPSAQTVVDERMAKPETADVLICMLWLRMGTPTKGLIDPDTGTEYLSGTYYEFIRAYRQFKATQQPHILLYRCNRAKNPAEIDYEQAGKVNAFFKRFEAGGDLSGLYKAFDTPDSLERMVRSHLEEYLTRLNEPPMVSAPPSPTPAWTEGATFDRYTLRRRLGEGGNGDVWAADEALPDGTARQVAIKVLKADVGADPVRVKRFRDELSIMARIDRPDKHIVPVHHYGERGGHLYVVMPLMAGGTLRQQIAERSFPLEQALGWLDQIGIALDFVQTRSSGLVHRDVKPENMLLSDDRETLYLSDFGLAISGDAGERRDTDPGKPAGTGRYMAPEQWRHETLSPRTDLYALGILAYELLTGHLPYDHTKGDHLLGEAHCEQDLPADRLLPAEVLRILRRACAKSPDERYPNARSFLSDLRNWQVDPANLDSRISDYLDWLTDEIYERVMDRFVELEGDERELRPLPIPKRRRHYEDDGDALDSAAVSVEGDYIAAHGREGGVRVERVHQHLAALERAVLIGEPGSGKSWTLQRLAVEYEKRWRSPLSQPYSASGRGVGGEVRPIPILVRLNEYKGGTFAAFVKREMDTLAAYHDRLLTEKRLVLLCDALNEMPRSDGQLDKLVRYLQTHQPRFVISCRVRDYVGDDAALKNLRPLEQVLLRELELPAIRDLIVKALPGGAGERLWREMGGTEAIMAFWGKTATKQVTGLFWDQRTSWWDQKDVFGEYTSAPNEWYAMHSGGRLIPLCRNPYMGRLLTDVYRDGQKQGIGLPKSRADLFQRFVGAMISRETRAAERRQQPFPAQKEIEAALVEVARALQAQKATVIAEANAEQAITGRNANSLLRAALDANILATAAGEDGEEALKFSHQLLQEYFAVQVLYQAMEADPPQSAAPFFTGSWGDSGKWNETIVMLGEFVSLSEGMAGLNRVVRWLAPASPEEAIRVYREHGDKPDLTQIEPQTREALIAIARAKIATEDWLNHPQPLGRAAAYRVLGWFDADNRPGLRLPTAGGEGFWCDPIPPGGFWYGKGDEDAPPIDPAKKYRPGDTSKRGTWTEIAYPFQIARHPVTNAQFQPFLDDPQGYNHREWWTKAGWQWKGDRTAPDEHSDPRFRLPNHPRINVRWYEAVAYCNWLTARLYPDVWERARAIWQTTPLTEIKGLIRLPTEQEWERAARGTDGRSYAWKDEDEFDPLKCNSYDERSRIDLTSAVGIFEAGESPSRALDMTGNVWEWSLSEDSNSNININSTVERVLRGGSWNIINDFGLRVDFRNRDAPDNRNDFIGCRLARS